jgi:uncharacterized membrane protein
VTDVLLLRRVTGRFWFIPAVLCLVAAVLAELLVWVDRTTRLVVPAWLDAVLYQVGATGSRDILGAIAGSSLAVAGTTFSITMAVLALTSSTYGPRLVRNFMADRGNQLVLGVYVATFLYSLLVLRSVRALGDPGEADAEIFVPHLAVNVAVLLAVLNVAVLIYFIHHISDSIQVSTIARRVRTELHRTVDRLYPEHLGGHPGGAGDDVELPPRVEEDGAPVLAARPGYLSMVDDTALMRAAQEADVLVRLMVHPGDYVLKGSVLAHVHPAEHCTEDTAEDVRDALTVEDARSPYQDIAFAVQQLTELAVRALSPGTNDPYTAVNALDDLSSGLASLAGRQQPSPHRVDDDGVLRVHAPAVGALELTSGVLDAMRWYAGEHPAVMLQTLVLVERVAEAGADRDLRARLLTQVRLLQDAFEQAGHPAHDVQAFAARVEEVSEGLARVGLHT